MIYAMLIVVWMVLPAVVGLTARNHELQTGGLAGGYKRLASMNPHLVGLIGASGGQVPTVAV